MKHVGQSIPRYEGHLKVSGRAIYVDDFVMDNMWYGVTVRSPVAKGRLLSIHFNGDIPWHEITVVTAKDIPGQNVIALIDDDQPALVDVFINHVQEAVVLLAHPNKELLEHARKQVKLEIIADTPVLDMHASQKIFKKIKLDKGNVDDVWESAYLILDETYETGAQEQLYIEPNGMLASYVAETGVTIWGSMQCPFYIHKAMKRFMNLDDDKIRVIQLETGGGFGGKEDYPSILAAHAALLSYKCGHPVKMVYDRGEDMVSTTKRHPSRSKYKSAVDASGQLLAMDIELIVDGGAYMTLTPVVLSRGTLHAMGPYKCPNVRIRSTAVATNSPPHGAFRGFGAPQTIFAVEKQMDAIARALNIEPSEIRRRNFARFGDSMSTGQIVRDHIDMNVLMEKAMRVSEYQHKRKEWAVSNLHSNIKRGIGLATFIHGSGFTGSGEKRLASRVGLERKADGRVTVLSGSTEIGQGTNTIFTQIAADALGIDPSMIDVAQPDTQLVPDSGPTVASRTTMVVGKLIEQAAQNLTRIAALATSPPSGEVSLKAYAEYVQPPEIQWDDDTYQGDAYPCYAKAVYVAEVSVDMVTYDTRVERFWALQDVGKVVNPRLAEGQIAGGVVQGIGYAIYENVIFENGAMKNNRMTNYIVPTAMDAPEIHVLFDETPSPYGPQGAVGIGELPLDGTAPAILAAIENATGLSFKHIPVMPEDWI